MKIGKEFIKTNNTKTNNTETNNTETNNTETNNHVQNQQSANNKKNNSKNFFKKISEKSFLEDNTVKKADLRKKDFEEYKKKCFSYTIISSLFILLFGWLYTHNILLSFGIMFGFFTIIFLIAINIPILKHKKYTKKVEVNLSFFLMNLVTELKVGKDLMSAIKKCSMEDNVTAKEYGIIIRLVENGLSFKDALTTMNKKFNSLNIKRTNSNLYNIYQHGNDTFGLKKFADELLLRQRIESKEFGGKLIVFALVFIAVSAIVPAMFASFILIGSYFMEIQFNAIQIFLIMVIGFPSIDLIVLLSINSKTPLFLRQ